MKYDSLLWYLSTCFRFVDVCLEMSDLDRLCILLFLLSYFSGIAVMTSISQDLKLYCLLTEYPFCNESSGRCIVQKGCLFSAKELNLSADLLLLVGLFCEVLASCKGLIM